MNRHRNGILVSRSLIVLLAVGATGGAANAGDDCQRSGLAAAYAGYHGFKKDSELSYEREVVIEGSGTTVEKPKVVVEADVTASPAKLKEDATSRELADETAIVFTEKKNYLRTLTIPESKTVAKDTTVRELEAADGTKTWKRTVGVHATYGLIYCLTEEYDNGALQRRSDVRLHHELLKTTVGGSSVEYQKFSTLVDWDFVMGVPQRTSKTTAHYAPKIPGRTIYELAQDFSKGNVKPERVTTYKVTSFVAKL
jgi:hypothetical protein